MWALYVDLILFMTVQLEHLHLCTAKYAKVQTRDQPIMLIILPIMQCCTAQKVNLQYYAYNY